MFVFFVLGVLHAAFIKLFSTKRKKMLHSTQYYLRTKLELPSTARRYRPGDLIYVRSNLAIYSLLTDTISV